MENSHNLNFLSAKPDGFIQTENKKLSIFSDLWMFLGKINLTLL